VEFLFINDAVDEQASATATSLKVICSSCFVCLFAISERALGSVLLWRYILPVCGWRRVFTQRSEWARIKDDAYVPPSSPSGGIGAMNSAVFDYILFNYSLNAASYQNSSTTCYTYLLIGKMWIYRLLLFCLFACFVCLFVTFCVFVWLRISPARIKLTA